MIHKIFSIVLLSVFMWIISPVKNLNDINAFFDNDQIENVSDIDNDNADNDSLEKKTESKFLFETYSCFNLPDNILTWSIPQTADLAFVHLEIKTPPPDRVS